LDAIILFELIDIYLILIVIVTANLVKVKFFEIKS